MWIPFSEDGGESAKRIRSIYCLQLKLGDDSSEVRTQPAVMAGGEDLNKLLYDSTNRNRQLAVCVSEHPSCGPLFWSSIFACVCAYVLSHFSCV